MRRSSRFRASTLLLAVSLSAAPVFARSHDEGKPPVEVHGLFSSLWHSLGGLLPEFTKGRSTIDPLGGATDGRGTIDPDGVTTTAPPGVEMDGRGTIDPNG
jgi:hypothetical protein